jgi:hypothetical protein
MSLLLLGAGPSSAASEPVELIVNGDFDTRSLPPWTIESGFAQAGSGVCECLDQSGLNANSRVQQTFSVESGTTYRVSWDAYSPNSGRVEFTIGGVTYLETTVLTNFPFQSFTQDIVATASNSLGIVIGVESLTFTTVVLDNISVLKL